MPSSLVSLRTAPPSGFSRPLAISRTLLLHAGFALAVTQLSACAQLKEWFGEDEPPPVADVPQIDPTVPDEVAVPKVQVAVPKPAPRAPVKTTEPEAAPVDPADIVGLDRQATDQLLGKPSTIVQQGTSLVWAYQAPTCVLKITFYPNLQTKEFHALQYTISGADGAAVNDKPACMKQLQASKKNERQ